MTDGAGDAITVYHVRVSKKSVACRKSWLKCTLSSVARAVSALPPPRDCRAL